MPEFENKTLEYTITQKMLSKKSKIQEKQTVDKSIWMLLIFPIYFI
jgi:hypothetical protein